MHGVQQPDPVPVERQPRAAGGVGARLQSPVRGSPVGRGDQLAVIALAYLAVGVWGRGKSWYRPRVVIPASASVAAVGLFWTVQRVLGG